MGQSPENVLARKETELKLEDIESRAGTEAQQERVVSTRTLAGDLKLLEERRQNISPLVRGKGIKAPRGTVEKPGILGGITRMLEPDVSAFEGLRETTSFTLASAIAGQTGRALSDQERDGLKKGLPDIGDTDEEAQRKLSDLIKQVESRLTEAGQSPEDAKTFSQSLLSDLGMTEGTEESQVAEEAIPSFKTVPSEEIEAVEEATAEKKSLGGFGENVLDDIQTNVEGILNIPAVLKQAGVEMTEEGQSIFGPGVDFFRTDTGKQIVNGVVEEYKNLITHPLEHAYEHPVNTVLDVIPFLSGIKKLSGAGKVGKATEAVSLTDEAIKTATGMTDELAAVEKAIPEQAVAQATKIGMLPSRAEIGAKTYSSAFIVPTKRARSLRPVETSAKMLDYGISGGLDDLRNTASQVTGDTGVLTKVTRDAIGSVQGEIPMGNTLQSAKNMLEQVVELTPAEENRILRQIVRSQKPGGQPMTMNPLGAFDTVKNLQQLGHEQLSASTYLTKNLKAEGIGKAYLAAADEIMTNIEKSVGSQNIVQAYKTPEIQAQLSAVSPKLAEEFMQAETLADIRSLQAPFVRLNQMIDLTEQAGNSAFQTTGRQIGGRLGTGLVGGLAFSPAGPFGTLMGASAGMVFGPPIEAAIEALRPSILTKTGKFIAR
jgi:hypothetical protein